MDELGGQRHAGTALRPGKTPGTFLKGGFLGPRADVDGCGEFTPTEIQSPDRPGRSESLYILRYPGPLLSRSTKYYFLE